MPPPSKLGTKAVSVVPPRLIALNHSPRLGSGHAPLGERVSSGAAVHPSVASGAWWTWRELNPRPPARQAGALPLSYRPGLRLAPLTQAALSGVELAALSSQHA